MERQAAEHRPVRQLAAALTLLWAATGVAVAATYRPGGPIDIAVMLACFLQILLLGLLDRRPHWVLSAGTAVALILGASLVFLDIFQ